MSTTETYYAIQNVDADFAGIYGLSFTYATARSTSYYYYTWASTANGGGVWTGQSYQSSHFQPGTAFLCFDTSAIPDNAILLSCTLSVKVCDIDNWTTTRDVGFAIVPLSLGAKTQEQLYDERLSATVVGNLCSSLNAITHTVNTWIQSEDDIKTAINLTGLTELAIVSTHEISSEAPATSGVDALEEFAFYGNDTGSTPYLTVTYVLTPNTPTSFAGTPSSSSQLDFTWTDNGGAADGYEVELSSDAGANYSVDHTTAADASSTSITGLSAGTQYCIRIRGKNSNGYSSYSDVLCLYTRYPTEISTVEIVTGGIV